MLDPATLNKNTNIHRYINGVCLCFVFTVSIQNIVSKNSKLEKFIENIEFG